VQQQPLHSGTESRQIDASFPPSFISLLRIVCSLPCVRTYPASKHMLIHLSAKTSRQIEAAIHYLEYRT